MVTLPERKYKKLTTFPWHFHEESEENVVEPPFANQMTMALPQYLRYIKKRMNSART